jgi:putative alpha-1,2-mannosidase
VQQLLLNGKPLNRLFIKHEDILDGGTLSFVMGGKPAKRLVK